MPLRFGLCLWFCFWARFSTSTDQPEAEEQAATTHSIAKRVLAQTTQKHCRSPDPDRRCRDPDSSAEHTATFHTPHAHTPVTRDTAKATQIANDPAHRAPRALSAMAHARARTSDPSSLVQCCVFSRAVQSAADTAARAPSTDSTRPPSGPGRGPVGTCRRQDLTSRRPTASPFVRVQRLLARAEP